MLVFGMGGASEIIPSSRELQNTIFPYFDDHAATGCLKCKLSQTLIFLDISRILQIYFEWNLYV